MKNYLKLGAACSVVIALVIYMKANSVETTSPLILSNVEALAADESSNIYCIGIGTVDCPIDHSKAKYVFEAYSLGL